MDFDWEGKWKVFSVTVATGDTIGLLTTPPSKFRIKKKNSGEFVIKSKVYMGWSPDEIELKDNGENVEERFEGEFELEDEGLHVVRLAAIPGGAPDGEDAIELRVSDENGGITGGTGSAGRG